MNAKENSDAVVIRSFCGNEGKQVRVLFPDDVSPIFGTMWRVRFLDPVLVAPVLLYNGKLSSESLMISRDAVLPDAWLMGLNLDRQAGLITDSFLLPADRAEQSESASLMSMDLLKREECPGVIEANLVWPDGWQSE